MEVWKEGRTIYMMCADVTFMTAAMCDWCHILSMFDAVMSVFIESCMWLRIFTARRYA